MGIVGAKARYGLLGTPLAGVRIDIKGADCVPLNALRFEIILSPSLPIEIGELERLWVLHATGVLPAPARAHEMTRRILILRTIDALAEGASLRAIGDGLICAGEWPGEGEWVKSRARRLVAAAHAVWAEGPWAILKTGNTCARTDIENQLPVSRTPQSS